MLSTVPITIVSDVGGVNDATISVRLGLLVTRSGKLIWDALWVRINIERRRSQDQECRKHWTEHG